MNSFAKQATWAAVSAMLVLTANAVHAQHGMLEIHGVITSQVARSANKRCCNWVNKPASRVKPVA